MTQHHHPAENRYDAMPYRRCGRWGLKLPVISLGGAFDSIAGGRDAESGREAFFTAFDLGVTHFDLANNYGSKPGLAEEFTGRILRELPRDEIIISTKAGFRMWPGPYGIGLSRKYLLSSIDQSLKRLGLDYVDIFYAHAPDPETPMDEVMSALDQIVRQGKALYTGVANFSAEEYEEAVRASEQMGLAPITIHQTPYNVLARGAEKDLFPNLQAHGTGCIVFYVLGQGVLSGKYMDGVIPPGTRVANRWTEVDRQVGLSPESQKQVRQLSVLAKDRGQSLAQMCIAWTLRHPAVTSALVGVSNVEQIRHNVAAVSKLEFSDDERRFIDEVSPPP